MTKYKVTERIAAAQAVEAGECIASVARRFQMSAGVVSRSMMLYQGYGQEGLHSHTYNWTAEEKYRVLQHMHENHLSCQETGIQFGISGSSTIWQWERRYLEKGIEGLESNEEGQKAREAKAQATEDQGRRTAG
jgi:transposase-like protein